MSETFSIKYLIGKKTEEKLLKNYINYFILARKKDNTFLISTDREVVTTGIM